MSESGALVAKGWNYSNVLHDEGVAAYMVEELDASLAPITELASALQPRSDPKLGQS